MTTPANATTATGAARIEAAIRSAGAAGRPAIAAFLTAGFPSRHAFPDIVRRVAEVADVVELGVPFSDPMADGVTIQEASRTALTGGVTLDWILDLVDGLELGVPVVLMSYLNPLLTRSHDRLASQARATGVDGFIVPDLPYEEAGPLRVAFEPAGLALVQLVTPLTPPARRGLLAEASTGFLYAVTRTGTTGAGGRGGDPAGLAEYAAGLRAVSPRPVLAGFGVRTADQVRRLHAHFDGVIVGSALIERLAAGEDPAAFLRRLSAPFPPESDQP
ncbi:MAG TPA: tryptophan synthase subunit alpha [Gemmatimonadota bacterium]|nr:tryptophan synthase subunit alpha [Gemmatimonadota bacterium]